MLVLKPLMGGYGNSADKSVCAIHYCIQTPHTSRYQAYTKLSRTGDPNIGNSNSLISHSIMRKQPLLVSILDHHGFQILGRHAGIICSHFLSQKSKTQLRFFLLLGFYNQKTLADHAFDIHGLLTTFNISSKTKLFSFRLHHMNNVIVLVSTSLS